MSPLVLGTIFTAFGIQLEQWSSLDPSAERNPYMSIKYLNLAKDGVRYYDADSGFSYKPIPATNVDGRAI